VYLYTRSSVRGSWEQEEAVELGLGERYPKHVLEHVDRDKERETRGFTVDLVE
jgi:hypothetical protein